MMARPQKMVLKHVHCSIPLVLTIELCARSNDVN